MKNIKKIYLDMDGVLVDLANSLERCEGRSVKQVFEEESHGDKNFDPFMWLIKKHNHTKPFLYANPMPDFAYFIQWIKAWQDEGIEVAILSSASRDEKLYQDIVEQKKQWLIHNNLGHLPQHYSKGGRDKANWAETDALLLDDYWENAENFKKRGGQALVHKSAIVSERYLVQHNLLALPEELSDHNMAKKLKS